LLATLVIGLREGLEAALIVGIIAAFLRKNGNSLRPMWLGVGLAVALSIAVGVGLDLVERSLPQSDQEAMESVIGATPAASRSTCRDSSASPVPSSSSSRRA
jgi:high-affinity iron transporter